MPPPPPFLLPPRRWSRVSALLAGAGRQRVAVALLALAAVLVAGFVWTRATPGLVGLPAGSRVQDAIGAAGGATSGADLDAVNLALKLGDGEQVLIPGPGDP